MKLETILDLFGGIAAARNHMLETRWKTVAERILTWLVTMNSYPFDGRTDKTQ